MNQINIKDLDIKVDITNILNAIELKQEVLIDVNGKVYINEECPLSIPIIFKLSAQENVSPLLDIKATAINIFKDYKPAISGTICTLKPIMAWQEIIFLNQPRMLYFDHQTDGVELFEDKEIEDYGWNCTPCDISYREISEFIESNCNGTFVFYDNEIQFNGFVIVDDIEDTRVKVKNYIINKIKEKIEDESIDLDDSEVEESLEFFEIKV
ncbi:hypothetical protein [Arcobacter sp. LA11]|uniref:hypothetical protein n=1 Tax=Arcobacter sp. LA11 TaxID=1898176 RepID=UPI0009325D3D|nr:hypothetical protein [Arcobacter sp. LA11]